MRARALAIALLAVAAPAWAQTSGTSVSGVALAYQCQYRLRYVGGLHDQSGTWLGGQGVVQVGRVLVRVTGLTGKLTGDTSVLNPDRTVRITSVGVGLRPAAWLELGPDVMARRVESSASTVLWRLVGGHVAVDVPLGLAGLTGTATGAYYPSATVPGDEKLNLALVGQVGVTYAPRLGAIVFRLAYRFERYDFAAVGTGSARLEQLRAVVVGLGLRLGR